MAVAMKESWTDDRLDDFAKHVDRRFDHVDQRFDRIEKDVRELRADVNSNFKALQRTLYLTGGGIIAALIGVIGTQL